MEGSDLDRWALRKWKDLKAADAEFVRKVEAKIEKEFRKLKLEMQLLPSSLYHKCCAKLDKYIYRMDEISDQLFDDWKDLFQEAESEELMNEEKYQKCKAFDAILADSQLDSETKSHCLAQLRNKANYED